jgi:hypothetical protein
MIADTHIHNRPPKIPVRSLLRQWPSFKENKLTILRNRHYGQCGQERRPFEGDKRRNSEASTKKRSSISARRKQPYFSRSPVRASETDREREGLDVVESTGCTKGCQEECYQDLPSLLPSKTSARPRPTTRMSIFSLRLWNYATF